MDDLLFLRPELWIENLLHHTVHLHQQRAFKARDQRCLTPELYLSKQQLQHTETQTTPILTTIHLDTNLCLLVRPITSTERRLQRAATVLLTKILFALEIWELRH